ncbi:MAG: bifunctional demethylmenaquinone methyltransferase/2-methoxy-6-polyprenyl-1,4-benzoquinol methylase UbiE [Pyrinomonadaceae bacterium]
MPDLQSSAKTEQARRVREMFATIAGRYDLLNHLLSGNVDRRWRRLVAKTLYAELPANRTRILDVACGTGDLSVKLSESGNAQIVGIDFCRPMLEIAVSKPQRDGGHIAFIEGDALDLPFGEGSFDGVTIAFGLRNLASIDTGIRELLRVLKPGGTLAVLEFSKARTPVLRWLFRIYFTRVLPLLGGLISGSRSAYQYLPESVSRFPDQEELASMMKQCGFKNVRFQNLTGGIAALHVGKRPEANLEIGCDQ